MTQSDYRLLLRETLVRLGEAVKWLRRSHQICREIDTQGNLVEEEYDALETLTSRFARVSDMLLQRAFRSIDRAELEEPGSLLDVLARAEKRGLIESVEQFRLVREVRNEVAHEYALEELRELFQSVMELTPVLFAVAERTEAYCRRYTPDREADVTGDDAA